MKRFKKFSMVVALAAAFAFPAAAQTADEIVAKAIAARGGIEKLKSVRTEKITGQITLGPDAQGPFSVQRERPHKMRMEMTIQGQIILRIFNGSAGWQINPFQFQGSKEVHSLRPDELKNIAEEADFEGPLVNWREKGNQVESMGLEKVGGRDAYHLKVTEKNGIVQNLWFDAETFRQIKWESVRGSGDQSIDVQSFFSDFRDVGGLTEPFVIDSGLVGKDPGQKIVIGRIELNLPMDNSLFTPPVEAPPATDSKPAGN